MLVIIFVTSLVTVVIFIVTTAFYLVTILSEESDDQNFADAFEVHNLVTTPVSSPTALKSTGEEAREVSKDQSALARKNLELEDQVENNLDLVVEQLHATSALKEDSSPEFTTSAASETFDTRSDVKSLENFSTEHTVTTASLSNQEAILINKFGKTEAKKILEDFDAREVKLGGTALHWCKSRASTDKLLTLDLPLNAVNIRHETALHVAVRRKKLAVIISLLNHNPDIDLANEFGETPLIVACKTNYIVACQLLLVHDADVNKTDFRGKSPRHYSSMICHRYNSTQKSPNAANLILAMLHELDAKRCPVTLNPTISCSLSTSSSTNLCAEGCSQDGTYNGNSFGRWADFHRESLYKRNLFLDLINKRRQQIHRSLSSNRRTASSDAKSRLLCIDGGGMRGVIVCQVLMELQKYLKRPVLDYFDWIGGTSVGAFMGCALALGTSLQQMRRICFELKDEVFSGRKPYNASSIENVLKRTLGPNKRMSDIEGKHLAVTTVIADRDPCQLRLFRNYVSPARLLQSNGFQVDFYNGMSGHSNLVTPKAGKSMMSDQPIIDENDPDPLVWQAVRASAAAPFFFKPYGPFLDGGIIANNPTLDMLSEFHNYHQVHRFLANRSATKPVSFSSLDVVVSLGTGRAKVKQAAIDFNGLSSVFAPNWSITDFGRSIRAVRDMFRKLMQQSCQTEDHILDRVQAWCASLDVPYFRINPPLATMFPIDDKRDEQLINALWQTKLYMRAMHNQIVELAEILDGPTQRCGCGQF